MFKKTFILVAFLFVSLTTGSQAAEAYSHPQVAEIQPGVALYRELDGGKYELLGTVIAVTAEEVTWKDSEGRNVIRSTSITQAAKYWFVAGVALADKR